MKKKVLASLFLGGIILGTSQVVFASEHQIIDNSEGQQYDPNKGVEIPVKGTLGKMDNTDPEENIPEGDERWLRVEIPTTVLFHSDSKNEKAITSGEYRVSNLSARPINVNLASFTLPQNAKAAKAIDKLSLQPKNNKEGEKPFDLIAADGVPTGEMNKLMSKLESPILSGKKEGSEYKFQYTGKVTPEKIESDKGAEGDEPARQTVSYAMTLKFEVLGKDGNSVK
ncbi:hypothetical protein ACWOC1_14390 [Enterococcus quebecensis]|uniref:WxL domain-containing protein n=1 Tax=Enterococcus quebecensis TaxID=903983 RepID=A0A1E5GUI5_9ENTE|nr:hypothetical protein [Enterococcus quebecensis]OEG16328.1 hypothetical protein BCR23_05415 [Enterococcus quebecensis]OJG70442.1 hypothetical protein RV12_GL001926 [Enterococcus quebecensis]